MNIQLSWDLFVVVFFTVIISYSFIIGRDNTLKVILGTYVSAIAADALGNIFGNTITTSPVFMRLLKSMMIESPEEAGIFIKVMFFVLFVILFAVRGAFYVEVVRDRSAGVRLVLSILYAVFSAGLIISIILVFVSGVSFIGGSSQALNLASNPTLNELVKQSEIIRIMLKYAYVWFFAPALAFLLHSFYSTKKD